jgi:hypothetical protein
MSVVTNVTDSVEPILKQWWTDSYEDLTYRDHPLLGMMNKEEGGGKVIAVPLKYGQNAGRSASFAQAQTNEADASNITFLVYPGVDYSLASVANTDIELSSSDRGAVVKLITDRTETASRNLGDALERDLFGSGYGTLGQILNPGGISGSTITLTTVQQATNFYPNQKVVLAAAENSAALRNAGASLVVQSVDLDLKVVTFTAGVVATIAAAAVGDYIFQQGDKTSATAVKVTGLAGWIPSTAPSSGENFFGKDRSVAPTQLAGWRVDGTKLKLTEAINRAVTRVGTLSGSKPNLVMMSPANMERFTNLLDAKAVYTNVQGKGITLGYDGIKWMSGKGMLTVMQSPFCPDDKVYVLTTSSWTLMSPGNQIMKQANRNGKFVDVYNADSVEIRMRTLGFCVCDAPGYNAVITVLPPT